MARRASSKDVAKAAGVSQATVSYVLTGRRDQTIRDETRQRVLTAAKALGYEPNSAARALVTGRTGMVALWVPFTYHSVFSHVMECVTAEAHAAGMRVVVVQTHDVSADAMANSSLAALSNVDGVIALDATRLIEDLLASGAQLPPIVSVGPAYSLRTDHVGVDLRGGAEAALAHLRAAGCRRIAFAGYRGRLSADEPRYGAYLHFLASTGAPERTIPLAAGSYEDSRTAVSSALQQPDRPDAVFCWNDEAAIGAIRACADLGIRVPGEVAVIGSDGIRETAFSVPTLSTVAQPFAEMCHLAWEQLQRRIAHPDAPPQSALLPMSLIARASTAR